MQYFYLIYLFLFFSIFSYAQDIYKLTVEVVNIKVKNGLMNIAVFNNDKDFLKISSNICKKEIIETNFLSCDFKLPKGNYAIAAFHDENSNNILDKNILGIPSEAYSFSNNIRPKFRAPLFSETKFSLIQNQIVKIAIKKWP